MKIGVGRAIFLLVVFATVPCFTHAQVVISEFMYDAPGSDSGAEWAELFNAGTSAVDLTKWKINDGSNHVLNVPPKNGGIGSIVIAPGEYIILADSAPNFESAYPSIANVIDTTLSLPNTSGTISLVDDSGAVVDSLSYTKDTGGAGDGNTLQRTSVSATTLAASAPTPGTGNLIASASPSGDTDSSASSTSDTASTTQTQTQTTATATVSSYVAPPVPSLFTDVGPDRTVIVGADAQFDARAYDKSKNVLDSGTVRFMWNFGDGATAEGESVLHHYEYPGRYALVLNIAQDKFAGVDEAIITAEPAKLSFSALQDGGVQIDNLAGRDLDLSGWLVRAGAGLFPALFTLPPHSLILSGSSMHISHATLGFAATSQAELQYPNGVVALQAGETSANVSPPVPASVPAPVAPVATNPAPHVSPTPVAPSPSDSAPAEDGISDSGTIDVPTTSAEVAAAGSTAPNSSTMWWMAAFGLATAAGGSLVAARRFGKKEWDITEET